MDKTTDQTMDQTTRKNIHGYECLKADGYGKYGKDNPVQKTTAKTD